MFRSCLAVCLACIISNVVFEMHGFLKYGAFGQKHSSGAVFGTIASSSLSHLRESDWFLHQTPFRIPFKVSGWIICLHGGARIVFVPLAFLRSFSNVTILILAISGKRPVENAVSVAASVSLNLNCCSFRPATPGSSENPCF